MAAAPDRSRQASLLRVVRPLDGLRRVCLAQVVRWPRIRALFIRRERRVAATLSLHATIAFAAAILCPVLLLIVGPVLVGIPHLAADVRHLIVRRRWPASLRGLAWATFALLAAVPLIGVNDRTVTRISVGMTVAASLIGLTLLRVRDPQRPTKSASSLSWRPGVVLVGLSVFLAAGLDAPDCVRLVLVHAHNLVPWIVAAALLPASRRALLYPAAFVGLAALSLVTGVWSSLTLASPLAAASSSHVLVWADGLAPGLTVSRAVGWTSAFAFLQSSHYALWLVAIPELDRSRPGATTLRTRLRLYLADCGLSGTGFVVLGTLALVAFAFATSWSCATHTYLAWAGFHAYAELAVLALWLVRSGRPLPVEAAARASWLS